MKKDILKKFDRKKQLMVSPLALAVSACGGGGAEEEITPSLSAVKQFDPTGDELIDMVTSGSYYRNSSSEPIFYGLAHGHYGEQWENPELFLSAHATDLRFPFCHSKLAGEARLSHSL